MIGLDYTAIMAIAKVEDVEMTPGVMSKLRALEAYTLQKQKEANENGR